MSTRYDSDFYGWTQEQAELIRAGSLNQLDTQNLLEEIEAMGRSERRELGARFKILLMHLLKWKLQSERQTRSWTLTIEEQRISLIEILDENPSLKPHIQEAINKAYKHAVIAAESETNIRRSVFPATCPWSFEDIIAADFYPE